MDTTPQQTGLTLEEIVRLHLPSLRRYLASLGVHTDLIDDLAQDVFLEVLQSLDRYDESRPFRSWLFGIARNLVRREFSKSKREARVRGGVTTQVMSEHRLTAGTEAHSLASMQAAYALKVCMGKLPDRTRQIIAMRFEGRAKSADIADEMRMTATAVRSVLMRARNALRQCIETRLTETQLTKALS